MTRNLLRHRTFKFPMAIRPTPLSRTSCIATIETRSQVDLKKVGAARYAADPSTEVLCVAYAVDDGPVQLWRPGDPVPAEFFEAAANPSLGCMLRTTTLSKPPLSSMCCMPASAGRSFRSSATAAPWRCAWRLGCRQS